MEVKETLEGVMDKNDLICEAMDRVEWEFSKIKSEKKLKKAVRMLEKKVKKILIDVEAT